MITQENEVKFWQWLKGKMDKVPQIDYQRIENTTGGGVPDVNMCFEGRDLWVELKLETKGHILLRKNQFAWLMKRAAAHGNVKVIALFDDRSIKIYTPPFKGEAFGSSGKYVSLLGTISHVFTKSISTDDLIKKLF